MSDVNSWSDFVIKLKLAKEQDRIQKISMPTILRCIYAGAFDSLFEDFSLFKGKLPAYNSMFETARKALKSSASLPKRGKKDLIGLCDVKNDIQLALWNFQTNPSGVYPFLDTLKPNLGILGFNKDETKGYYTKRTKEHTSIATDEWQRFFTFIDTPFWNSIQKDHYKIFLPGIITKAEVKRIMNNTKELMTVSIYTGRENVSDLVIWPKWGETTVNVHYKESIKVGKVMLLEVKPTYRDGKAGGKINGIQIFSI